MDGCKGPESLNNTQQTKTNCQAHINYQTLLLVVLDIRMTSLSKNQFLGGVPFQVAADAWPEKIDGATAINMKQHVEDSVQKWMQSQQLRTPATPCLFQKWFFIMFNL